MQITPKSTVQFYDSLEVGAQIYLMLFKYQIDDHKNNKWLVVLSEILQVIKDDNGNIIEFTTENTHYVLTTKTKG